MKNAGTAGFLILAFGLLVITGTCASAFGQRMQFPSEFPSATPSPGVTLDGTIQPVPPECRPPQLDWDPYAVPGAPSAPGTLWQNDPSVSFPSSELYGTPAIAFATATKFLQEVRLDYVWMPGTSAREFGINDIELTSTFAIPAFSNPDTPFLITPGFAVHLWNGPTGLGVDLPSKVFDAYLDAAWNPQITPWLGGELSFRVGVYSDFERFTSDSLRYTGTGLIRVAATPAFTIKGGVWYLDRQRIQLLPAGGIVWTPNSNIRFEFVFPNPKLARHLTTFGTTEWWGYLRGEYGGGSWSLRAPGGGVTRMDYNDIRVAVGVDFTTLNRFNGLFEVGAAFEREIFFSDANIFDLNTTVFVRGGFAY